MFLVPLLVLLAQVFGRKVPQGGEVQFRRWQQDGLQRLHLLYAPISAKENASLPLWLLCPGTNIDALSMLSITDLTSLAEDFSVAVAVLEGVDLALNVGAEARAIEGLPDDVSYTRAVIADAANRIHIDDQRIYCIGSSRGARFCSRLASELTLAGLMLNAGLRFPRPNNASASLPIIAIHDLRDEVNPYAGGGASYWQESVGEVVQAWAEFNQCSSKSLRMSVPNVDSLGPTWLERHLDCASFAEVWILVTETGRHKWPGRNFTELGWRFLLRQETLRGGKAPSEGESWPEWPLYTGGAGQLATCMAWLLVSFNL